MNTCQCSPHADLTCDEARVARRDPSGTLDLRRAFIRALEKRWRKLSRLATSALVDQDLFGLGSTSARALSTIGMQGGRVPAFQQWIDTALADIVLGLDREGGSATSSTRHTPEDGRAPRDRRAASICTCSRTGPTYW
jgi:hypothetical protein